MGDQKKRAVISYDNMPEEVAAAFGMNRNAVDQIRSRMMVSLRSLVAALEKVDGE